jgi:tripartite-type tricarboxylate transporter receptor subunit TctC
VIAGAASAAAAAPFVARAQTWPSGNIRFIVPYPPGGSNDVIVRLVQPMLQQRLGVTVIVDNRSGAYLLATSPQKPFKSHADVIDAAKAKPNSVSYGSVGSGSIGHLAMVLLAKQAGVSMVHVPYRGGGPAMNDAIAGHVDLLVGSVALSLPQVQSGNLRGVVHTGKEPIRALPNVASVSDSGYPGFNAYAWWGVFAPAGTPKPIVERFGAELVAALREPNVSKQLIETQQINVLLAGPDELRKFVSEQMRTWGAVVRENNIKGDT